MIEDKDWTEAEEKEIENEFNRIADVLVHQGDVDVLVGLINYETKKDFIVEWHNNDEDNGENS